MTSYPTEPDLVSALDRNDELVRLCAAGQLTFAEFCNSYDNFYWAFALDGHESDLTGVATLARYKHRIAPHQIVAEEILAKVCTNEDSLRESYQQAGRFDAVEAVARLKLVAATLPGRDA